MSDGRDVARYVMPQRVGASMEDAWKLPIHLEDLPSPGRQWNGAESHLYSLFRLQSLTEGRCQIVSNVGFSG